MRVSPNHSRMLRKHMDDHTAHTTHTAPYFHLHHRSTKCSSTVQVQRASTFHAALSLSPALHCTPISVDQGENSSNNIQIAWMDSHYLHFSHNEPGTWILNS
ncbi:unnamed protein product [Mortierella alpina]